MKSFIPAITAALLAIGALGALMNHPPKAEPFHQSEIHSLHQVLNRQQTGIVSID
jgi:hypothetical protein